MTFDEPVTVYNLEVEDFHAYFVTDTDVLVHNAGYGEEGGNGTYEDAPYHHQNSKGGQKGGKSKAPMDGQGALDNSLHISFTGNGDERRIGISIGEFVVLDGRVGGLFHGHVRDWEDLTQKMQALLRKAGMANKKGKIL